MVQRRAIRWTQNSYATYTSVTQMQNELGLRSLEQRRADARVIMLFKIVHGLVAIPLPSYFEQPSRMTRHSHPLALRQIHTSVNYYKYLFFPAVVVYWTGLENSTRPLVFTSASGCRASETLDDFQCKLTFFPYMPIRTSDSLNEGLPIKMIREKFQRK